MLPALVLVALIYLVREGRGVDLSVVQLQPSYLVLAFLATIVGLGLMIIVWRAILRQHNIRAPLRDDIRIYTYSTLGWILPGGIWSIVSRSAFYLRLGMSGFQVAAASVVETLMVGIGGMALYGLISIFRPEVAVFERPELGVLLTLLALVFIQPRVFIPFLRWIGKISKREIGDLQVTYRGRDLVVWIGIEMFMIFIGGAAIFFLLGSLVSPPPEALTPILASWAAATAAGFLFFWVPGTPLLRDGAMILALAPFLSTPTTLLFVVFIRLWNIGSLLLIAGLVWLVFDFGDSLVSRFLER